MLVVVIIVFVMMYMSPTMIAAGKNARRVWEITALNFFLGWTIIGWIAALVWSLLATERLDTKRRTDDLSVRADPRMPTRSLPKSLSGSARTTPNSQALR